MILLYFYIFYIFYKNKRKYKKEVKERKYKRESVFENVEVECRKVCRKEIQEGIVMRMKVKKIWVRFENQAAYTEQEEKLREVLRGMPGDCDVVVYLNNEKLKKILCEKADVQQISILENVFGQENVRIEETEEGKLVRHIVPDIVQIIPCNHDMYAVFDEDGESYKYKVLMYALCDDGRVYPLVYDEEFGVSSVEDTAFYAKCYELVDGKISFTGGKSDI